MVALHPTKQGLMDACLALAEESGFHDTSVNDIVQRAGVAKGTFYVHFVDKSALLVSLHRRFYEQVFGSIAEAVGGLAAGPGRLLVGAIAYLDACLAEHGVKALLVEARSDPALAIAVAETERELVAATAASFVAMGYQRPEVSARGFVAVVASFALAEVESGALDPAVREGLAELVERLA